MPPGYMLVVATKTQGNGDTIAGMETYNYDTRKARIEWALERKGMSQLDLAAATGLHHVYISQIKNDTKGKHKPTLETLQKIAAALDVTVGFLLLETDNPSRDPAPVYYSPEADEAAQLVDNAQPEERTRMLAVLKALAGTLAPPDKAIVEDGVIYLHKDPEPRKSFAQRIIDGERNNSYRQRALLP